MPLFNVPNGCFSVVIYLQKDRKSDASRVEERKQEETWVSEASGEGDSERDGMGLQAFR